jgi:hypothetical protein
LGEASSQANCSKLSDDQSIIKTNESVHERPQDPGKVHALVVHPMMNEIVFV